jgi:AcrR family transcriptional regulator
VSAHAATPGTPNRADELRRRVAERNVAAILDATLAQLERDPRPSLAAIAKTAGVSRPTLYAHFPTREDLVEATAKRALEEAQREIAAADIDDGPASDALQRLITAGWRGLSLVPPPGDRASRPRPAPARTPPPGPPGSS